MKKQHSEELSKLKEMLNEKEKIIENLKKDHKIVLNKNNKDLKQALTERNEAWNKVKEMEIEKILLQENLKTTEFSNNELQTVIKTKEDQLQELKIKFNEALNVAELIIGEKEVEKRRADELNSKNRF